MFPSAVPWNRSTSLPRGCTVDVCFFRFRAAILDCMCTWCITRCISVTCLMISAGEYYIVLNSILTFKRAMPFNIFLSLIQKSFPSFFFTWSALWLRPCASLPAWSLYFHDCSIILSMVWYSSESLVTLRVPV